jgi:lysophospholipase L1-like esterase
MKNVISKIVLIVSGLLLAILLMEAYLRLFQPQIFPIHPQGMYIEDPDIGYVLTPGYSGELVRSEFHTPFQIGQSGLRGRDPTPPQEDTIRILVLGDSQAWGFGVTDSQTFSVQLEELLSQRFPERDIQVLNAGVPGYGTADQLAFLETRGEELQPDIVVVQFLSVNDLIENQNPASEWAIIEDGMLTSRATQFEDGETGTSFPNTVRKWLKANSHVASLTFDVLGYLGVRAGVLGNIDSLWGEDFTEEQAQLGITYLAKIADKANELNANCIFLYSTGKAHATQDVYEQPKSARIVIDASRQANVPWIDSAKLLSMDDQKHNYYYPKNGHWTPEGHAAIARILEEYILELSLIESDSNPQNHQG